MTFYWKKKFLFLSALCEWKFRDEIIKAQSKCNYLVLCNKNLWIAENITLKSKPIKSTFILKKKKKNKDATSPQLRRLITSKLLHFQ